MKKNPTPKKSASSTSTTKKSSSASKPSVATKAGSTKKENTKSLSIEKACEVALSKLRELNIDEGLQSEIQWCLGSYNNDGNPSGLYDMAKRALAIFTVELASKSKSITAKLISDLEKAIGDN